MSLNPGELIHPIFVKEGITQKKPVDSMPGVFRYAIQELGDVAETLSAVGLNKALVFGIPEHKDELAKNAARKDGIAQKTITELKKHGVTVYSDVCLCQYTPHGECRILVDGKINELETLKTLSEIALSHAKAGADYVAPSAVLDGQVAAIRSALDENGFSKTKIMSYSAKFASPLYEPFRGAVESTYAGGVRAYQLPADDKTRALARIKTEVIEGADAVIVKPAQPYLDVISEAKKTVDVPVVAYQVSGEYTALKSPRELIESINSIKRAGADYVITYGAVEVAGFLIKKIFG